MHSLVLLFLYTEFMSAPQHAAMVEGKGHILLIRPRQGGPLSNITYIIPEVCMASESDFVYLN